MRHSTVNHTEPVWVLNTPPLEQFINEATDLLAEIYHIPGNT
jgi:hypothetical protein